MVFVFGSNSKVYDSQVINKKREEILQIFRSLLEPIYTPDDLLLQPKLPFLTLFRLADKHGSESTSGIRKMTTSTKILLRYILMVYF